MKKYLHITNQIAGIGGGQIHSKNILHYYKTLGYEVFVCCQFSGDIVVEGYNDIPFLRLIEIGCDLSLISSSHRSKVIRRICKFINYTDGDEVLVECNFLQYLYWGELIAKATKGKNFLYLLGENDKLQDDKYLPFLKFKLDRDELTGIKAQIVPMMFERVCKIPVDEKFCIVASASSSVQDVKVEKLEDLKESDYTIGLVSRLQKTYVIPTLEAVADFIKKYLDNSFNLIIIGDGSDAIMNNIKRIFLPLKNVNLVLTGGIMPIPQKYVELCDVSIGSAACAGIVNKAGRITIAIDGNDLQPIGILNHTTTNSLFREDEPVVPIQNLLHDILIEKKYPLQHEPIKPKYDINHYNKLHVQRINASAFTKEYYDVESLCDKNPHVKCRMFVKMLKIYIETLIGEKKYKYIWDIMNRH